MSNRAIIFAVTVTDITLGFILGIAFNHYYPEYTAWIFR